MCGIAGGIGFSEPYLENVSSSIKHRGPDSDGVFVDDDLFLCHTRLSIQDTSISADQPMYSDDKRYVIVFNGEIYNHKLIRKKINHNFISTGDTETVLYAFIKYGEKVLNMLNGIFSFAIYDSIKKQIFIARDHFGVKPLYIYRNNNQFLFSSELKTFLNFKIDKELNHDALLNYITFLYSPGELTPFKKVTKVLPGTYLKFNVKNPNKIAFNKYYKIPFNGVYLENSEEELIDLLDEKLKKAVERQMLSDVPLGFFLSGGLDSSLIVAIAKKINPNTKLECFTIDDENKNDDLDSFTKDIYYAKKVAKYLDVNLNIVKSEIDIVKDFDKMIWHLDEPQADPAPLHVLNIASLAKQKGIKVLLGGTAGDDIFSGYRRHQALSFEKYISFTPKIFIKLLKIFFAYFPLKNPSIRRLNKLISNFDKPLEERILGYFSWIKLDKAKSLFKIKNLNYDPLCSFKNFTKEIPNEHNYLNKMLYLEMKGFLPDHNLNYTDKMSMAVGIETRVPFLDIDLVEFALKVPPKYKMKGKATKYLLKKVAERYLPHDVIYRPKTGFGAPVRDWIINDMHHMIVKKLLSKDDNNIDLFNFDKINKLIDLNKQGKIDASYSIWSLLAIDSWVKQFSK